jgi:hypothetical protein
MGWNNIKGKVPQILVASSGSLYFRHSEETLNLMRNNRVKADLLKSFC